jgi:hypothetical protein
MFSRTSPSQDPNADEAYSQRHYELALEAYRKASSLKGSEVYMATKAASMLDQLGRSQEATKAWKSLYAKHPSNSQVANGYAHHLMNNQKWKEAIPVLKDAEKRKQGRSWAVSQLEECYKALGETEKAAEVAKKAKFYGRIPDFIDLEYSEEIADRLESMYSVETLKQVMEDRSTHTSDLLAALCWSHPHNEAETLAFEELGRRGEYESELLFSLLQSANSRCTIRQAAKLLADQKDERLYDFIEHLLLQDRDPFGMHMDIATAMDRLGDSRAVPLLIKAADLKRATTPNEFTPTHQALADSLSARIRATLALGGFATDESKSALEQAINNPVLRLFAAASLYRMTREEKYLDIMNKEGLTTQGSGMLIAYWERNKAPETDDIVKRLREKYK